MRPDRERLFQLLRERHGSCDVSLRTLAEDLEPIFRMADEPEWPEGTDCGVVVVDDGPRKISQKTQPLREEAEPACVHVRIYHGPMSRGAIEDIVERFHEQVSSVIGYERVVELGSILGDTLLDPLFLQLGARGISTYLNLQFLALYRVAAEVAGLATESELLGIYIRRFIGDMEAWHEIGLTEIEEDFPDIQQAG